MNYKEFAKSKGFKSWFKTTQTYQEITNARVASPRAKPLCPKCQSPNIRFDAYQGQAVCLSCHHWF